MNLAERKRGLGGTDSPVVLGVSPWKSRKELWEEKRGLTMDIEPTPAMRRGIALEPLIAKIFSETTKRDLLPGTKPYHSKYPFICGHPDYFWGDKTDQTGILEIKCLGLRTFAKAKREGGINE